MKEPAPGTDIGDVCQLLSHPLGGKFRGQSGGELLLGCYQNCFDDCKHLCVIIGQNKANLKRKLNFNLATMEGGGGCHYMAFDQSFFPPLATVNN